MSDRARVHSIVQSWSNQHEFFDTASQERVFILSPIFYEDDFMAAGKQAFPTSSTQGVDWVKKLVQTGGTPTVAGVASAAGGVVQNALDATSEKQEATLYWADNKHLDVTKGLIFEARVKLSVLPSAAGVQAVWGVSSSWIDGPDNASDYVEFGATANGNILLRSQDGTTQNSIASGVTVLATDWHIYRIDMTDVTDVKFFIDGAKVSGNSALAFAASGSSSILQPYFSVYKPSGTGVATLQVDYARAAMFRQ